MIEKPPRIQYLNTDLDLVAARDLMPLTGALQSLGVRPLNVQQGTDGQWYSLLEITTDLEKYEPEETIRVMLDAIEGLEVESKQLWAECSKREFNIGYDCGDEPWAFNNGLARATLERMASVGASLRITLYPYRRPKSPKRAATKRKKR